MSPEIKQKAMLAKLNITQFAAKKKDKTATESVQDTFNANKDAGAYNKALFAKDFLKDITAAIGEARTFHYAQSLPWRDEGKRILPSKNYLGYTEGMRKHKATIAAAVNAAAARLADQIETERTSGRLGNLFKIEEYPADIQFIAAFTCNVEIEQLPQAADFRVDLQADEVAAIKKEIEARNNQALSAATMDLWKRLNTAVAAMAERLSEPKAIFRDTLVTNLREVTELIPVLNVNNDEALNKIAKKAAEKLTFQDAPSLREDINLRKTVAKDATDLMATMAAYMS